VTGLELGHGEILRKVEKGGQPTPAYCIQR